MELAERREFLKDNIRQQTDFSRTGQARGKKPPPVQKPPPEDAEKIELPSSDAWEDFAEMSLLDAIANRQSRRTPTRGDLSLAELSFLLWCTQGVRSAQSRFQAFRVVPSAGCRHAFETYVGHVGQNLYLACEAVGCGTCAIGAYGQQLSDDLVGVDGEEEFTIYMAPVTRV
mgnify:CR=1 FL=1